jgi:hypothetical protein
MIHSKILIVIFILLFFIYININSQTVQFLDVSSTAGVQGSISSPYSTNCAWGDYNNDGFLDLYVTNWGSAVSDAINELYKNNGDGTFTEVGTSAKVNSPNNSICAVWGDYDNDGWLDLYVVNFYEQDELYHNNGDGTFTYVTIPAGIDILSTGNSTSAVWGDYDNDGNLDIYLCKYYAPNELYHNNGDGTFSLVENSSVRDIRDSDGAVWVDYNNDGFDDLYVVNREQDNKFYRNNKNGTFTEISGDIGLNNTGIGKNCVWGDIDNDGDFDVYIVNIGANNLYINNNGVNFSDKSVEKNVKYTSNGWESWDASFEDFNGDGSIDLFTVGGSESGQDATTLFINSGAPYRYVFGDFTVTSGLSGKPLIATSCAVGDYDNDGDPDIFITTNSENVLFKNQKEDNSFGFLKVRVVGKGNGFTNKFCIGCKVKVYEKGKTSPFWYKQIRNGPQPPELFFGLSKGKSYTVEVIFPGLTGKTIKQDITMPRTEPLIIQEQ